jgi:hypothetical protein
VTGGGPGEISAALIYRHKTLYKALLAQAAPTKNRKAPLHGIKRASLNFMEVIHIVFFCFSGSLRGYIGVF